MDNATHAFAGLLLADATVSWIERRTGVAVDSRLRRATLGLGLIAAELPDADLLYSGPVVGMGRLGYLLHHRGHTHTIVFAVVAAFVLWWLALWIRKRATGVNDSREQLPLLALALAGTLSHVLLDYSNVYGVHPFWPFDNRWVYGDSVFIVEPWLWVAAIPPLLFGPRRAAGRILLTLLLGIILLASWTLGEMTRTLALVVTVGAALWMAAQWFIPSRKRVLAGVIAWCAVEAVFVLSSAEARRIATQQIFAGEQILDVVLSPAAANPFCLDAILVTVSPAEYIVRSAAIAPWTRLALPSLRAPGSCRARGGSRFGGIRHVVAVAERGDRDVTWGEQWTAPRNQLASLAAARCEIAAALRFMRVPVWQIAADSSVDISDARFGVGTGGFSDIPAPSGPCTLKPGAWIPPWTPPRSDVLGVPPS